jgi:hypothetical protein
VEETPELDRFYRENKDSVNFLIVAVQDTESAVRGILARNGATLPVLMDAGEIATAYRVTGVPTAWSLRSDGSLGASKVGYSSAEDLQELVEKAQ